MIHEKKKIIGMPRPMMPFQASGPSLKKMISPVGNSAAAVEKQR